jgi:NADH:ubiquinone oxidoreductase subunit 6 (subunit J)
LVTATDKISSLALIHAVCYTGLILVLFSFVLFLIYLQIKEMEKYRAKENRVNEIRGKKPGTKD